MTRPKTPEELANFISSTLSPAVASIGADAQAAKASAEKEAQEAAEAKAAAEQAALKAAEEQAQAEAQAKVSGEKAALAGKTQDELTTISGLMGFIPKLPDQADRDGLFAITSKQVDGLMADLGLSYDAA